MYSNLGRKITNQEYDDRLVLLGNKFIRVDGYVNSKTSIKHKCVICGKIFKKKPKEITKLKCNCVERKEDFLNKIKNEKNIDLIGEYYNIRSKTLFKCKKCGLEYVSTPKTQINAIHGCPNCSGKKFSTDFYKSILPSSISLVESEKYDGSDKKILHKCNDCGNFWSTKPNYILHMGCGCPFCSKSKGEKKIIEILNNIDVKFEIQKKIDVNGISYFFDFYLPILDLYIEYDGIQHYKEIDYFGGKDQYNKIKNNDKIKDEWINKNKKILIRIPYYSDVEYVLLDSLLSTF